MSDSYNPPGGAGGKVAGTPADGFALQNGTPTIFDWTAPNDGNQHAIFASTVIDVTSATTGGVIYIQGTCNGNVITQELDSGNHGAGNVYGNFVALTVDPGSTVKVTQGTPVTAGAASACIVLIGG